MCMVRATEQINVGSSLDLRGALTIWTVSYIPLFINSKTTNLLFRPVKHPSVSDVQVSLSVFRQPSANAVQHVLGFGRASWTESHRRYTRRRTHSIFNIFDFPEHAYRAPCSTYLVHEYSWQALWAHPWPAHCCHLSLHLPGA